MALILHINGLRSTTHCGCVYFPASNDVYKYCTLGNTASNLLRMAFNLLCRTPKHDCVTKVETI